MVPVAVVAVVALVVVVVVAVVVMPFFSNKGKFLNPSPGQKCTIDMTMYCNKI